MQPARTRRSSLAVIGSLVSLLIAPLGAWASSVHCVMVLGDRQVSEGRYPFTLGVPATGRIQLQSQNYLADIDIQVDLDGVVVDMHMTRDGEEPGTATAAGFARLVTANGSLSSDYVDLQAARLRCEVR